MSVFVLYLTIAASGWVLRTAAPSSVPGQEGTLVVLLLLCCAALIGRLRFPQISRSQLGGVLGAGLLMFLVPGVLAPVVERGFPAFTRTAMMAVVPAAMVVLSSARGSDGSGFLDRLGASMAGLAGVFLLLPADPGLLLSRPIAAAAISVTIGSVACGVYLAYWSGRSVPLRQFTLLLLGPSLVLLALTALLTRSHFTGFGAADVAELMWDLVETSLLVLLVRSMEPIAFSSRYLLIPLITSLEGALYLRPEVTVRMVAGVVLLLLGSVGLLRRGEAQADSPLSLL